MHVYTGLVIDGLQIEVCNLIVYLKAIYNRRELKMHFYFSLLKVLYLLESLL